MWRGIAFFTTTKTTKKKKKKNRFSFKIAIKGHVQIRLSRKVNYGLRNSEVNTNFIYIGESDVCGGLFLSDRYMSLKSNPSDIVIGISVVVAILVIILSFVFNAAFTIRTTTTDPQPLVNTFQKTRLEAESARFNNSKTILNEWLEVGLTLIMEMMFLWIARQKTDVFSRFISRQTNSTPRTNMILSVSRCTGLVNLDL